MKPKNKKEDFQEYYQVIYVLGASQSGNMLTGKGILRTGYGNTEEIRGLRAGYGNKKIDSTSSFNKL